MLWVYGGILAVLAAGWLISRNYRKDLFAGCRPSQDPLVLLYPLAARIVDLIRRILPEAGSGRISDLLRSLYVKENIGRERYLYLVRKTSLMLAVAAGAVVLGLLVSVSEKGVTYLQSLQRADYGSGTTEYELEVEYRDSEDTVQIAVDEVHYTRSEILERFERSVDAVKEAILGDNVSQDQVTEPLHLISEYDGFDIYWEIDDIASLNYNGDIRAELKEDESRLVTLYATFSMDEVTQIYTVPIRITGKDPGRKEQLVRSIQEAIDSMNDRYSREVALPQQLDGEGIVFRAVQEHRGYLFILLAAAGAGVCFFLYDRRLENRVKERQAQLMADFTEIVSKLNLLYEAGLSIHGAFERIVADHQAVLERNAAGSRKKQKMPMRYAYQEMQLALEKIRSGVSETRAYAQFGRRCGLYPYMKLGNLLEQNLSKGTKGMQDMLKEEMQASFEERKRLARKKGEEAGTKMLIPMVMMLLVVIAIVAIPALMTVNL